MCCYFKLLMIHDQWKSRRDHEISTKYELGFYFSFSFLFVTSLHAVMHHLGFVDTPQLAHMPPVEIPWSIIFWRYLQWFPETSEGALTYYFQNEICLHLFVSFMIHPPWAPPKREKKAKIVSLSVHSKEWKSQSSLEWLFGSIKKIDISIYQQWNSLIFLQTSQIEFSPCKEWNFIFL